MCKFQTLDLLNSAPELFGIGSKPGRGNDGDLRLSAQPTLFEYYETKRRVLEFTRACGLVRPLPFLLALSHTHSLPFTLALSFSFSLSLSLALSLLFCLSLSLSYTLNLAISLSHLFTHIPAQTHTRALSLSLSLSRSLSLALSLSLSLFRTHSLTLTHSHTHSLSLQEVEKYLNEFGVRAFIIEQLAEVQGYLAHKKHPPRRTLQ